MSDQSHAGQPQLNATPLIDVLLVLLVMLIFTIPIATHKVALNLPHGKPQTQPFVDSIVVGIDFDGALTWNGAPVQSLAVLERRLRNAVRQSPAPRVHVDPDVRGRYETVAQVLAAAQRAHVTKLSVLQVADR